MMCCTPLMTTGPASPGTLRIPLTRSTSSPRPCSSMVSQTENAVQSIGSSNTRHEAAMRSSWRLTSGAPVAVMAPGLRLRRAVGFVAEPCPHVRRPLVEGVLRTVEHGVGPHCRGRQGEDGRLRIEAAEPRAQPGDGGLGREVALGDDDAVGHRRLLGGFGLARQLGLAVHGVHRGDDPDEAVGLVDDRLRHQRVQDGDRVREARGLR